jgi:hypothetical protein
VREDVDGVIRSASNVYDTSKRAVGLTWSKLVLSPAMMSDITVHTLISRIKLAFLITLCMLFGDFNLY